MSLSRDRVLKLLRLSASDNDHEAASAVRQVHKLLKENGLDWEHIIVQTGQPVRKNDFYRKTSTYSNINMNEEMAKWVRERAERFNQRMQDDMMDAMKYAYRDFTKEDPSTKE